MNRQIIVSVISLIVYMFLLSSGEGLAHQKTGMMGQGSGAMMGGRMMGTGKVGHPGGGLKAILHEWAGLLFREEDQLGLTDEQLDEIQSLVNAHMKTAIRKTAERRIIDIELRELLMKDEMDFTEVEKRIRAAVDVKAEMEIDGVQAMEKIKNVLSEEQRKKVKSLLRPLVFPMAGRPSGPCMMGQQGMMGGGEMMQGMMGQGGMMGARMMQGQSQTDSSPSSMTKTDSQGPVTVEIAFDPKPQPERGELIFEVEMDTHSVELGDIDLGQLSVLKNDQGVQVNPSQWNSPGGGGHHVTGSLVFPNMYASGKPLVDSDTRYVELVVRDVGGADERVFRWDLR